MYETWPRSLCSSPSTVVCSMQDVRPTHRHRSLVQFYHLVEPLQQQRPCLPDGRLYDLSSTWEVMNYPHTLPTPQRQVVCVALHRGFSVNVTGVDILPGEGQHGRSSMGISVSEGIAECPCEPST